MSVAHCLLIAGIFRGTWNPSTFSIVDRSGLEIFEKHPRHHLVELRIDGKSLPPEKTTGSRRAIVTSLPAATMKIESDGDVEMLSPTVVPRVILRAPAGADRDDSVLDYGGKYYQLLEHTEEPDRSLDSLRKRSYVVSALFALIGGFPAGVGLFLTLFLARQQVRSGAPAPIFLGKLRFSPAYKAQRVG